MWVLFKNENKGHKLVKIDLIIFLVLMKIKSIFDENSKNKFFSFHENKVHYLYLFKKNFFQLSWEIFVVFCL